MSTLSRSASARLASSELSLGWEIHFHAFDSSFRNRGGSSGGVPLAPSTSPPFRPRPCSLVRVPVVATTGAFTKFAGADVSEVAQRAATNWRSCSAAPTARMREMRDLPAAGTGTDGGGSRGNADIAHLRARAPLVDAERMGYLHEWKWAARVCGVAFLAGSNKRTRVDTHTHARAQKTESSHV